MTRSNRKKWKFRMLRMLAKGDQTRSQIIRLSGRITGEERDQVLHNMQHRGLATMELLPAGKGGFEAQLFKITDRGRKMLEESRGQR